MASPTGPAHQQSSPKTKRCSPVEVGALALAQASNPQTEEENAHGQVYGTGRARVKLPTRGVVGDRGGRRVKPGAKATGVCPPCWRGQVFQG